jgi:NADH-quinone oxidoreductase subunit I
VQDFLTGFASLFQGMWVTGVNLVTRRKITEQYPYVRRTVSPRYRGLFYLPYNEETKRLNCTGCTLCEQACPTNVISMTKLGSGKHGGVSEFNMDLGRCMFCNLCIEACPFDAIYMGPEYELASSDRNASKFDIIHLAQGGAPAVEQNIRTVTALLEAEAAEKAAKAAAKPAAGGAHGAAPAAPRPRPERPAAEGNAEAAACGTVETAPAAPRPRPERPVEAESTEASASGTKEAGPATPFRATNAAAAALRAGAAGSAAAPAVPAESSDTPAGPEAASSSAVAPAAGTGHEDSAAVPVDAGATALATAAGNGDADAPASAPAPTVSSWNGDEATAVAGEAPQGAPAHQPADESKAATE